MEIIHIVLGKANPNRMNGVNKVVYQLATKQAEHKINVSVWGITHDTNPNYGTRNFKTRLFKKYKNPFKISGLLERALKAKKGKAVFHIHGGWIPAFYTISKILKENNIPFVFTPHGAYNTIAMKRSSLAKGIYFNIFEKKLLNLASKIHCLGQSEMDGLNSFYPNSKTVLLPYGFSLNPQAISNPANNKEMIIGFVGRVDIYTKGLDLLLTSFAKFHKNTPDSRLWIVGDGEEKNKLIEMVSLMGLSDVVTIYGPKFGEEKDNLMKQMHIFAHPSRNEGLPSSVLEASHLGIPCVITKATNLAEYVNKYEAGIAVENENVSEIENAFIQMHSLLKENKLIRMKYNAQNMVRNSFNWNHLIGEFSSMYKLTN